MDDNTPKTVQECDEQIKFFSELSQNLGLPVEGMDELLELRKELEEKGCH